MAILKSSEITKRLASIKRTSGKLQDDIHHVACHIVGHALEHGDVTLADKLLDAMGAGARGQAMIAYLETFGPFRFETKSGVFALNRQKKADMLAEHSANAWVDNLLAGVKWYDYTKERKQSIYDVEKMVVGIINAASSKVNKGEVVANAELLRDLQLIVAKYRVSKLTDDERPSKVVEAEQEKGSFPQERDLKVAA